MILIATNWGWDGSLNAAKKSFACGKFFQLKTCDGDMLNIMRNGSQEKFKVSKVQHVKTGDWTLVICSSIYLF